ncbi:MAG: Rrf2 family transcriptional regulator [Phycisphaeraceae bacterium]
MISHTAEYALRAMVCLADHVHAPLTSQQLADRTRVPLGYLAKIMQQLGRADLVVGQRGPNGGFSLTRPPAEISILQVVAAVDPIRRVTHCPLGLATHTSLCPLHRSLDDAVAHIENAFSTTSLADLLDDTGNATPLCEPA